MTGTIDQILGAPKKGLGIIGGGRNNLSCHDDIAVMQSLSRRENLNELLDGDV